MEEAAEEDAVPQAGPRGQHIKKRALRNKGVTISFDEKDLRDYVTGFHKRKKKRRKEAQKKQEEALRRKRIEERKKRKMEREATFYGGAPPASGSLPDEDADSHEEDEYKEQVESISGTQTYESGDLKVTVTTCEIKHEENSYLTGNTQQTNIRERLQSLAAHKKHNLPVTKKQFKKTAKKRSQSKPRNKIDKKKGKKGKKRAH